jgi:hypothetical protein
MVMDTIIKLLEVLLTWPVAVLIICLTFFIKFKDAISIFLKNIKSIKTPWGGEVQTQSTSAEIKAEAGHYISPEEERKLEESVRKLMTDNQLTMQEKEQLKNEVEKAYNFARYWKFSFLNQFYVFKTKQVLQWFSRFANVTKDIYHENWKNLIDETERNTILDVLTNNYMLVSDGINYQITPHGFDFLEFIGYIPSRPK